MDTPEVPTYDRLMWPTLAAIQALGGSGTNAEINSQVVEDLDIPEDVQQVLLGGGPRTKLEDRLNWARSYLRLMGLLENVQRGVSAITSDGKAMTEEELRPALKDFSREYRKSQRLNRTKQVEPSGEDAESWQDQLLTVLLGMHPDAFERLCKRLLREAGFSRTEVSGQPGDGGLDGVGVYNVALISFPVYFQAKKWRNSVGSKEVRDFRGALSGRGEKGLLITTSTFTSGAKAEARRDGAPPVDLIDGEELCELLRKYQIGVHTEMVEEVTVNEDALRNI